LYTLVICEKPAAAKRIAQALGEVRESRASGISIFEIKNNQYHYKICTALGHLYSLRDVTKNRSIYPVLDLEWAPITKNSQVLKAIKVISELAKDASSFVHACDYDQEGEVIGYSILRYACGNKYTQASRAKFSTLTDEDIRNSFANLGKPNYGLAEAGRSRHMLDFIYGVNLSRALVRSFKSTGKYRNLSIGRVQGPTLAFAANKEIEIKLHIPDPYWMITAQFEKQGQIFFAHYENPKVEKLAEAKTIVDACIERSGTVNNVKDNKSVIQSPVPFNIGDLQREAYSTFKVNPAHTLAIAEKLYLQALISYPRTSSQKLPPSIGYDKIIFNLSRINKYNQLVSVLLSKKKKLVPNEGRMMDPAHPAIYPTGFAPRQKLSALELKIYDLIVRRFLAAFGESAVSRRIKVTIDVGGYIFETEGMTITYEGWIVLYKPYARFNQRELPELHEGDELKNIDVEMEERLIQSPYRYNQASLLSKMEQEKIGTKTTRADIISTLFKRNYLTTGRGGLEVTDLGFAVIDSMREFAPAIVSTNMTRVMEEELANVEQGSADSISVIEQAADRLLDSLFSFLEKEEDIGARINDAVLGGSTQTPTLGLCPMCKKGQLSIVRSRTTQKRFIGCSNYREGCKATAPLPQKGSIRIIGKPCPECNWPLVGVVFARGAKQWRICTNNHCPSKERSIHNA